MIDDMRKYMEAAVEKLTPAKAQAMAKKLVSGGGKEQVNRLAKDLLEWSQRNRERLETTVQRQVRAQLKALGVATKEEVDTLRKRVRELERAKRPAAKRSAAKRTGKTGGGAKAKA